MSQKSLTLIIPAFDRPAFLRRLLQYYAQQQFPFDVLVADSSPDHVGQHNRRIAEAFRQKLRLTYRRYDARLNLWGKIAQATAESATPFVAVCDDDDFLVAASLADCIEFLEAHSAYAVAQGRAVSLSFQNANNAPNALRCSEGLFVQQYLTRNIEDDDVVSRLHNHLEKYSGTYNAVHRRADLLAITQLADRYHPTSHLAEILATGLTVIRGKAKALDQLHLVRQNQPDRAGVRMPSINEFRKSAPFTAEAAIMIDCLAEHTSATTGLPIAHARCRVQSAVDAFFEIRLRRPQDVTRYKHAGCEWIPQVVDPGCRYGQDFQPIADLVLRHPDGVLSAVDDEQPESPDGTHNGRCADNCLATAQRHIAAGRLDEAVIQLVRALLSRPEHEEAQCLLADVFIRQSKLTAAIAACRHVLSRNRASAVAHKLLGDALRARGTSDAAHHYDQALSLRPRWRAAQQARDRIRLDGDHNTRLLPRLGAQFASLLRRSKGRVSQTLDRWASAQKPSADRK